MQKDRQKILIPTPVLAELVMLAGKAGPDYVARFNQYGSAFEIVDFNQSAAIELALMNSNATQSGGIRAGSVESMAKIKFDRQIVAIAKVNRAQAIYSCDQGLLKFAKRSGIDCFKLSDLPFPATAAQETFRFSESEYDKLKGSW